MPEARTEKDALGSVEVPHDVYYGIFTQRAKNNFQISNQTACTEFITSLVQLKKACATVNMKLGVLDKTISKAIIQACDEILQGNLRDQFVLDVFQAGAGTPFNMNANEVIANRATELLGGAKGQYLVHPNNHVNMSQSSNDVIPTTLRITSIVLLNGLIKELLALEQAWKNKAKEYTTVVKIGRTHYQDAVPITYGQVFTSYAVALHKGAVALQYAVVSLSELGIGGTAIGTGITSPPKFRFGVVEELKKLTGIKFTATENPIETTWNMAVFVQASSALKQLALVLDKIAKDLMFLSSGPDAGIAEIMLLEVEPGSSIMPGKVNPSIVECLSMVCYDVIGNDTAITMAADSGNLELNVMTPCIAYNLFNSIQFMARALAMFRTLCVEKLVVNKERCKEFVDKNLILITALNPYLGYEVGAALVKQALREKKSLRQVLEENKVIPPEYLDKLLNPQAMTQPSNPDASLKKKIQENEGFKKFKQTLQ